MAESVKNQDQESVKSTFYNDIVNLKKVVESQFILSLYNNADLFFDYNIKEEDFSSDSWRFYFRNLSRMLQNDYKTIDEASYNIYIETTSEKWQNANEMFGGYETIRKGIKIVETENIDGYYQDINRYRVVLALIKKGFPIEQDWESKYSKMTLAELNDYLEGVLQAAFVDSDLENDKVDDISFDLQGVIDRADQGEKAGLPFTSPLMEDVQHGMATGNITMLAANSGVGKSFMVMNEVVTASAFNGEPLVMIINEEESEKVKQDLMAYYINNYIKGAEFNKYRFIQGQFTLEEKQWLNQAKEWIEKNISDGMIRIVAMTSFSIDKAIKIIKKYAKLGGVKYFCIDTFKIDSNMDGRNQVWLDLMTNMVKLYDTIKKAGLDVHCFVTYQLGKIAMKERYLTQNSLGTAKNVADVVSSLILMRPLAQSEKTGKSALKVIDENGHSKELNEDDEYFVLFWDKNRRGPTNKQIVLRADRGLNKIWDIGYTQIERTFD